MLINEPVSDRASYGTLTLHRRLACTTLDIFFTVPIPTDKRNTLGKFSINRYNYIKLLKTMLTHAIYS